MPTRTNTKAKTTESSSAIDLIDVAAAERTSTALDAVRADRQEISRQHRAAVETARQLRADVESGEIIDVDALVQAEARAEHLAQSLAVQERRVAVASRAVVTDDPAVARAVAPMMSSMLGGVPVQIANQRPKVFPSHRPAAVIVQARPTVPEVGTGFIGGRVVLHYARTSWHRQVTPSDVEQALRAGGVAGVGMPGAKRCQVGYTVESRPEGFRRITWSPTQAPLTSYTLDDGSVVDRIEIDLMGIAPAADELPILVANEPQAWHLRGQGDVLGQPVAGGGKLSLDRQIIDGDVKTTVLRYAVDRPSARPGSELGDLAARMSDAVTSHIGRCLPYLGRVVAVSDVKTGPLTGDSHGFRGIQLEASVTFQSRIAS